MNFISLYLDTATGGLDASAMPRNRIALGEQIAGIQCRTFTSGEPMKASVRNNQIARK